MNRSTLNLAGVIILSLGTCCSGFAYWHGQRAQQSALNEDSPLSPEDSRIYVRDVERYNGPLGMLVESWKEKLSVLKEPGAYAAAIELFSIAIAAGCFTAASKLTRT